MDITIRMIDNIKNKTEAHKYIILNWGSIHNAVLNVEAATPKEAIDSPAHTELWFILFSAKEIVNSLYITIMPTIIAMVPTIVRAKTNLVLPYKTESLENKST